MGLVTRDKFLHMKNTIQERREEEAARAKKQAEQQQEQVPACAALLLARRSHQKPFSTSVYVLLLQRQPRLGQHWSRPRHARMPFNALLASLAARCRCACDRLVLII